MDERRADDRHPGEPQPRRLLSPAVEAASAAVMKDVAAHDIDVRLQMPGAPGEDVAGQEPGDLMGGDDPADLVVQQDDGSLRSVYVYADVPDAESAAHVADVVHDEALEVLRGNGRDTAWPSCPEHPGTHPMVVVQGDPAPSWACPRPGSVRASVGTLGTPAQAAQPSCALGGDVASTEGSVSLISAVDEDVFTTGEVWNFDDGDR